MSIEVSRRVFGAALAALCAVVSASGDEFSVEGAITAQSYPYFAKKYGHFRCFLDDEDVTRRCYISDQSLGEVGLFVHRDGRPFLIKKSEDQKYGNFGDAARETRRGRVRYVRGRA